MSKMSLEKFIEMTKGTEVDFPNATKPTKVKGQCVSLIQNYIYNCLGQPAEARGHAKDWITSYVNEGLGETVSGQKTGDIIVFKNEAGGLGHIGIWVDGRIYDQNNLRHDNGLAGYGDIFSYDYVTLRPNTEVIVNEPVKPIIRYAGHVQDIGWQDWITSGVCGTVGQAKRLEAIKIDAPEEFEVEADAHIQNIGWVNYGKINKDTVIGTVGKALRLECLRFKGPFKYKVQLQDTGWTPYTLADGISTLGSVGQALRIEAIEIVLL